MKLRKLSRNLSPHNFLHSLLPCHTCCRSYERFVGGEGDEGGGVVEAGEPADEETEEEHREVHQGAISGGAGEELEAEGEAGKERDEQTDELPREEVEGAGDQTRAWVERQDAGVMPEERADGERHAPMPQVSVTLPQRSHRKAGP